MILNDAQIKIVEDQSRFIFVLAGAGSGKTRVIAERIKRLIHEGVKEDTILCLTFTRKAAHEMKSRLSAGVIVDTFHGYCYELLSKHQTFKIFEFNQEFEEEDILQISNYKNQLTNGEKPKQYDYYQSYLKKRQLIDYDDLLLLSIPYIQNHLFNYIFIDEFQDTNLLQFTLLEKMVKKQVSLFAVGDPDQSIYAFRGAKVELINHFIKKYQVKVMKLEHNYRSHQRILDGANHLIDRNLNRYKKRLVGRREDMIEPKIYIGGENQTEVKIIELIKNIDTNDIAILYRNHFQAVRIKQILKRHYLFHVKLLTMHEAKGLEFDCIILIGCELLPYDKDETYSGKEEERRLFFVGLTRAKRHLYLFSKRINSFLIETKIPILHLM